MTIKDDVHRRSSLRIGTSADLEVCQLAPTPAAWQTSVVD